MLHTYMLKQMGQQEMAVFRMGDKFALVQHDRLQLRGQSTDGEEESGLKPELYNACLIINNWGRGGGGGGGSTPGTPDDPMKLVLKYFLVLTRQRDCYPIRTLEKAFGEFRGHLGNVGHRKKSATSVDSEREELDVESQGKPVPVKQHIGMRKEHVNYRGYSNVHQLMLYNALKRQSDKGRERILEMVEMSKKKCRRDYLWQRLLIHYSESEDQGKKPTESDDSTLSPLSSSEFCELLEKVSTTPLREVDPQLTPLFHMPLHWYRGLFTALINKYPRAHRCFTSTDRKTQYLVVLNSNNLDMFAMLSLNEAAGNTELCVVMKDPPMEDVMHSPDTPNLPLYSLQTHVEDIVNVCCYHIWASML
ncbi:KICSTOR complex protein SZT2 [Aplysia californica]|uniref:KICSTOR complex protein SZT2 n=1 Tax=Aplysia californica TaxID=6500 RepID=A0ABM0K6A4_APLCA|nr:KICSTOR complex protein SZT2 [Aplysia californica]